MVEKLFLRIWFVSVDMQVMDMLHNRQYEYEWYTRACSNRRRQACIQHTMRHARRLTKAAARVLGAPWHRGRAPVCLIGIVVEPAAAAGRGACAALSDQPEPAERDAGGAGRHMICMHYLSRATAARAPTTEHFDHLFYLQPEGPRKRLV